MLPAKLAFVDIETTGMSLQHDRVIEVGVLRVENGKLVGTYKSLVNPETHLPPEIQIMTGITARELESSPTFSSIRKDLLEILDGCIFTAHNARFDYGFLKTEFRREGVTFKAKNLCTVKLSRHLFPRFKHHGLDSLIDRFDIKCKERHRAFDDARVLWEFYQEVQKKFSGEKIEEVLARILKKPALPIGLSEKDLDRLPEGPGVYIFYAKDGMPLYVGKSVNIHDRVLSHFAADHSDSGEMKISRQIDSIETISTVGELGALFKESQLVKKLQPLYNHKLRHARKMIILRGLEKTANNYHRVTIEETEHINPETLPHIWDVFKSKKQAREFLYQIAKDFQLCEKLLGLEKFSGSCFGYKLGRCKGGCVGKEKPGLYNARLALALMKNKIKPWPFKAPIMIQETDVDGTTESHVVDKWCYLGTIKQLEDGQEYLEREIKFDLDTYKILNRYLSADKNRRSLKPFNSLSSMG